MIKRGWIDADAHVREPRDIWRRYMPAQFTGRGPFEPEYAPNTLVVDGIRLPRPTYLTERSLRARGEIAERYRSAAEAAWDARSQLAAMDREGIAEAVLYPTRGLLASSASAVDPALALAIARAYNTWLSEFRRHDRKRLHGAAIVPLLDVDGAIVEARHAILELGHCAIAIRPNPVNGRNLYDPAYAPFFACIEELGVALAIHEGGGAQMPTLGADRLGPGTHLMQHAACHPFEQMFALMTLVFGGVLERHPRLRVAFLESGSGWLPYWLDRLDSHRDWLGAELPEIRLSPAEYFRRQCWISADCEDHQLSFVIQAAGDQNLVFASDYPHPDAHFPDAVAQFRALPGVSPDSLERILTENPRRLYGLSDTPGGSGA